ncbi:glycosyltransferase family 2 protein [Alteriqipengyuania lutimaris]|nr:glycosyltransferase [Alteriqipengyuania lutimaris]MBB3033542.1 hypothetical protein [Alteriqipengyuania lutimaris]
MPDFSHEGLGRGPASAEEAELAALLASPPFVGKAELMGCRGSLKRGCDFAIAIPVRNEERRLPTTLKAISAAMHGVPFTGCAVFVLNDTSDSSPELIERWALREGIPFLAVEVSFDRTICNAPHSRRLALDMAVRAAPQGALFTTDADTMVGKGWIDKGLRLLSEGYDLICEDVLLDEAELSALPAQVREVGDAERAYLGLCDRLWRYWTCGRACTLALRPSGASLAMNAASYFRLGGLPTPPVGEDRALCDAMLGAGFTVNAMENFGTRTSARLTGRALGGCGDALAERALSADPECDSRLKPVWLLHDEATLWMEIIGGASRGFHELPKTCAPMTFSAVQRELQIARKLAASYGLDDA